jgi:hypothetical protein
MTVLNRKPSQHEEFNEFSNLAYARFLGKN